MGEPDEVEAHDQEMVDAAIATLMRHFDSVQIFVTRQEGEQTLAFATGKGNWYAIWGQVNQWLDNSGVMHICEADEDEEE